MISESARSVLAESERLDGTPPVSDQALLAASQDRRRLFEFDGDALGILGEGEIDLVVRPDARGRGVGGAALAELLRVQDRERPGELRAWAHGENPAAEALLHRTGFAPIRTLYRLALDPATLPGAIAESRPLPEGFRLESLARTGRARAEEWVRVNAAAFADHPEQGGVTLDDFEALTREPWFDAEDLILAVDERAGDGGRLAGYTWIKTVRDDGPEAPSTETELYVLGVDPAYAGRGLGAALLGETLRRMSERRPDRVTLYVDGDNGNALALYERAGFGIEQRSTQWLRPSPGA